MQSSQGIGGRNKIRMKHTTTIQRKFINHSSTAGSAAHLLIGRKVVLTVKRDSSDGGIVRENCCCAVSLVYIAVHNRHLQSSQSSQWSQSPPTIVTYNRHLHRHPQSSPTIATHNRHPQSSPAPSKDQNQSTIVTCTKQETKTGLKGKECCDGNSPQPLPPLGNREKVG